MQKNLGYQFKTQCKDNIWWSQSSKTKILTPIRRNPWTNCVQILFT